MSELTFHMNTNLRIYEYPTRYLSIRAIPPHKNRPLTQLKARINFKARGIPCFFEMVGLLEIVMDACIFDLKALVAVAISDSWLREVVADDSADFPK